MRRWRPSGAGPDVVVQAGVGADGWIGYADVLRRVERPSALGAWSDEVLDTKLSRETRGGTILQLCAYTEMLGAMQGYLPVEFHVVTPSQVEPYRFDEFGAYYRLVKARLRAFVDAALAGEASVRSLYPEPTEHCDLCRWSARCEAQRRADDHLSYVAGLARLQQLELEGRGITTLAAFGALASPLGFEPSRGNRSPPTKSCGIRQSSRFVSARPARPRTSCCPSRGTPACFDCRRLIPADLFLDLEGDPFAREGGREYLFGLLAEAAQGPRPQAQVTLQSPCPLALGPKPWASSRFPWALGPGPSALSTPPSGPSTTPRSERLSRP